jgi:hypothetical protein
MLYRRKGDTFKQIIRLVIFTSKYPGESITLNNLHLANDFARALFALDATLHLCILRSMIRKEQQQAN